MAKTESKMIALGTIAPEFSLPDVVSGKSVGIEKNAKWSGHLVMFICNHCPFVKHIQNELKLLGDDFKKHIQILAISSNDVVGYPEDSPDKMKELAKSLGWSFPYLYDESQKVARSFDAVCTPDFFLYDSNQKLFYRGQLDDSRPGNGVPVSGKDLRNALNLLIEQKPAPQVQKPSLGCNIKFRNDS